MTKIHLSIWILCNQHNSGCGYLSNIVICSRNLKPCGGFTKIHFDCFAYLKQSIIFETKKESHPNGKGVLIRLFWPNCWENGAVWKQKFGKIKRGLNSKTPLIESHIVMASGTIIVGLCVRRRRGVRPCGFHIPNTQVPRQIKKC